MRAIATQFTLFSLLLASSVAHASFNLNLTPGVTPISHDIYALHMTVFWICVGIGVVVFGTMIYILIHHRKSLGVKPAHFHEHLGLEIVWTIIPFFILVSLAIPGTWVLMDLRDTSKPDLTIKVTGYQWKWQYEYIDNGVKFFSNISTPLDERMGKKPKGAEYLREVDHPLYVPIHRKIRFLMTANDVIHSWWVPDLGVKQDAVPGYINENWTRINKPGIYRGQCAELCGMDHAFMPIVVVAVSEKEFDDWLVKQGGHLAAGAIPAIGTAPAAPTPVTNAPVAPSSAAVQAIAPAAPASAPAQTAAPASTSAPAPTVAPATQAQAAATQAPTTAAAPSAPAAPAQAAQPSAATSAPAAQGPAATAGAPGTKTLPELIEIGKNIFQNTCAACHQPDGSGMPPTYPNLKTSAVVNGPIDKHIHTVVFGVPGTAMQAFGQQFSPEEIAGVITYERNEIGSKKGDIVQPSDIVAAEKAGGQ